MELTTGVHTPQAPSTPSEMPNWQEAPQNARVEHDCHMALNVLVEVASTRDEHAVGRSTSSTDSAIAAPSTFTIHRALTPLAAYEELAPQGGHGRLHDRPRQHAIAQGIAINPIPGQAFVSLRSRQQTSRRSQPTQHGRRKSWHWATLQVRGNHLELEGEAREAPPSALARATRINFLTHRGLVARPRASAPKSVAVCNSLHTACCSLSLSLSSSSLFSRHGPIIVPSAQLFNRSKGFTQFCTRLNQHDQFRQLSVSFCFTRRRLDSTDVPSSRSGEWDSWSGAHVRTNSWTR